jgi:hypothetical protein
VGLLDHNVKGVGIRVYIKDRSTGKTQEITLVNPTRLKLTVHLDNTFYLASDVAKKFILVKEFSHLLYVQQHARLITEQILAQFEISAPEGVNLPLLFWSNGQLKGISRNIPSLGDYFDNAFFDFDGAGYWHNTPAFGKMKKLGHLSPRDINVLAINNRIFIEALQAGLLIENKQAEFSWAPGIEGPFSPPWLDTIRKIIKPKT